MMDKQQRGGTFLGFILGVLVGLGGALAVAVYVTKVPVPFINKDSLRSQDSSEAQRNRNWDPNAPLYGKNPAPSRPAAPGDAPSAATGAASAPSDDPLGDLARARSEAASAGTATAAVAPTAAAPANDPFAYFVQAGAFRTRQDADAQRARLAMLGLQASVTEREQSGRPVFRVRVGPYSQRGEAAAVKEKLDGAGVDAALVRVQR